MELNFTTVAAFFIIVIIAAIAKRLMTAEPALAAETSSKPVTASPRAAVATAQPEPEGADLPAQPSKPIQRRARKEDH